MTKRVVVVLLVIALALAGGGAYFLWKTPVGRKWRAERYARKAEALVKGNAREAARLACMQAIELDPNNLHATRVFLAVVPPSDFDKLTFLRSRIADLDPKDQANLQQLAVLGLLTKRIELAATSIATLAQLTGETVEICELRVRLALAADQIGAAEAEAKKLIEKDPSNLIGRLALSLADVRAGRKERLVQATQQLREISTNKTVRLEALRALQQTALQSGDLPAASQYANEIVAEPGCAFADHLSRAAIIVQKNPEQLESLLGSLTVQAKDNSESLEWIVTWLQRCAGPDRALAWIDQTPVLSNSWQGDVLKSKILINRRQWPQLVTLLEEKNWERLDFLRKAYLSLAYSQQKEGLRTAVNWREAMSLALKNPQASRELANITKSWPDWAEQSERLLWDMSQLQPQNAEWALRQLFENYQRAKAAKSLLRVSRALAELEPNNEKLKNNVAFYTLLTDGNVQEIEGSLGELYQKKSSDPVAASTYAFLQLKLGKAEEAVRILEKLPPATLQQDDIGIYYAVALHAVGRTTEARKVAAEIKRTSLLPEEMLSYSQFWNCKALGSSCFRVGG